MKAAPELRKAGAWGALFTALLGLGLWSAPGVGQWLKAVSFDSLALVRGSTTVNEVVIVVMDEESHRRLRQSPDQLWDRSLQAKLLDTLIARGARAVAFDVFFADESSEPQPDDHFVAALQRASGKVVLAARLQTFELPGQVGGGQVSMPIDRFASLAAWGVVEVPKDPNLTLRQHPAWPQHASLASKVAEVIGVAPPEASPPLWLNYYGAQAFRRISYWQALQPEMLAPDVFSNKVVFVGKSQVVTQRGGNSGDEYPTPLTRWTGQLTSGVEIQATTFVNLWRRDWLEEPPQFVEGALLILCGGLFGFALPLARPLPAVGWAAAGALVVGIGTLALFWARRLWFPWAVVIGVHIPFALGWSVLSFVLRASQGKGIPDHTLLRCVGRGGYGEVWLASDIIGGFHAVKIVYRRNFPNAEPFEREFNGMQKFAPISRSHPGLVHILHVGRNDLRGCFYYIMEAADDETRGANLDPDTYEPRTLAREMTRRGRLPVPECVQLGLDLTSALDFLHERQLIHRDIKPANIIFVNGQPKLADVGLVTSMQAGLAESPTSQTSPTGPTSPTVPTITRVGTSGYLPPEGHGQPQADIYALGMTLYEAATGCQRTHFPELPTDLDPGADADALLRLHEILLTACETDPTDRYASAAAMRAELAELQTSLTASSARTV